MKIEAHYSLEETAPRLAVSTTVSPPPLPERIPPPQEISDTGVEGVPQSAEPFPKCQGSTASSNPETPFHTLLGVAQK